MIPQAAPARRIARFRRQVDEAVAEIGGDVIGVAGDVASLADLDRLFEQIRRDHGRLDVVFANAGLSESAALGAIEEAHFDRIFGINVKGLLFTVQKALPLMTAGGSIVLNGSGSGSKGFAALSVYSATKAAIRSFARTWTSDLKARGIRVNSIAPGPTATDFNGGAMRDDADLRDGLAARTALGRVGQPDEIADAGE